MPQSLVTVTRTVVEPEQPARTVIARPDCPLMMTPPVTSHAYVAPEVAGTDALAVDDAVTDCGRPLIDASGRAYVSTFTVATPSLVPAHPYSFTTSAV